MKRKNLSEAKHPFNRQPFEAFCCGSWHSVDCIRIRHGNTKLSFVNEDHDIDEKDAFANVRVKSRKATLVDCSCFLHAGVDVCAYLLPLEENSEGEDSGENEEPVWVDARICAVERKPHDSQCRCKFLVNRYIDHEPLGSEVAKLSKEREEVTIEQISILQKLGRSPCEGEFYRWDFSEDSTELSKTKLFIGKFSCDLSFLAVASTLKQSAFDVRSLQNKIVYQFDDLHAVNFKVENGVVTSTVVQIVTADCLDKISDGNLHVAECSLPDDMNLRRSKRRQVQPERFMGFVSDSLPYTDIGWIKQWPLSDKLKEDIDLPELESESELVPTNSSPKVEQQKTVRRSPRLRGKAPTPLETSKLQRKVKSSSANRQECKRKTIEFIANGPTKPQFGPVRTSSRQAQGSKKPDYAASSKKQGLFQTQKISIPSTKSCSKSRDVKTCNPKQGENKCNWLVRAPVVVKAEKINYNDWKPTDFPGGTEKFMFGNDRTRVSSAAEMKKPIFEPEDMVFDTKWYGKAPVPRVNSGKVHSSFRKRDHSGVQMVYKKPPLSANAYNKILNSYMKNIDSVLISKQETSIMDQWIDYKAKTILPVDKDQIDSSKVKDEEELSENETLWREMEISLATSYIREEEEVYISHRSLRDSCSHDFKLDEEIGILCHKCGFVETEIKYVTAPFLEFRIRSIDDKYYHDDAELNPDMHERLNISSNKNALCKGISLSNDNVWALIPDLRDKLHAHQKKAFEFLWRNIAGSVVPEQMEKAAHKIGGCVVSHTPGAGKTFLIIAFLVSYSKLFPGKRPLVLAPKTTLYTWHKEFIKWEIPLPVHLMHSRTTYGACRQNSVKSREGLLPNTDVMHILDCLEKVQKWLSQPSVLVMGYSSFWQFTREDAKSDHRKYMAKVLTESPGILILDEGHNPRSTKSRMRKLLMRVETDNRILLSGTLFQNNFCEYFNTLTLARPRFPLEVLKQLDSNFNRNKAESKARRLESRARKLFLDSIAERIDSTDSEQRMEGLDMLRYLTCRFIDVYEAAGSDHLPGLQIYTILLNSTETQHDILVKLKKIMTGSNGYPLEVAFLVSLACIHPWLVTTSVCARNFCKEEDLVALRKLKYEVKKASKVMFVLNLVYRVVKNEKVLIFCHNLAPIRLFAELFEHVFRWQKGKEILVITGDLELFERGRIIDKFEEPNGASRVLLASITACAEGISLTAASRVVLLDSEWNPSKTKQAVARAFRPGQEKIVYVYQLLVTGTIEEDKYRRTTWKEWVSSMIFSEEFVEEPSRWQKEKIEDDVLREIVEEDHVKSFHMIMKNEKASTG